MQPPGSIKWINGGLVWLSNHHYKPTLIRVDYLVFADILEHYPITMTYLIKAGFESYKFNGVTLITDHKVDGAVIEYE